MTDGDRGVALQQQQRHRLAHDLRSADHHCVFSGNALPFAVEQLDHPGRCARLECRAALHEQTHIVRMKPVHILGRVDRIEHQLGAVFADGLGQRRLHQDAVALGVRVQPKYGRQHLVHRRGGGQTMHRHEQTGVGAGPFLVTHVNL